MAERQLEELLAMREAARQIRNEIAEKLSDFGDNAEKEAPELVAQFERVEKELTEIEEVAIPRAEELLRQERSQCCQVHEAEDDVHETMVALEHDLAKMQKEGKSAENSVDFAVALRKLEELKEMEAQLKASEVAMAAMEKRG